MTSLLSLVLTLKPREAVPAPLHLGRAAHAALLRAVNALNPALAAQLHDAPPGESGPKPFTCSSLMGKRAEGRLDPNGAYMLRYTALTSELSSLLLGTWSAERQSEIRDAKSAIELDGVLFDVVDRPARSDDSLWAAQTTFEELSAPWLLARQEPAQRVSLLFASPTTFHSGGRSVPLPLPELVFGSLLERWNAFAPVALPEETRRYAAECLAVSRYDLETRSLPFKEGAVKIGMVGQVTFAATHYDRYWLSLINLLAEFALFAGVGAGVTMGMGQTRCLRST
jgi:CRISPR-associated endoribonuclease Cas6